MESLDLAEQKDSIMSNENNVEIEDVNVGELLASSKPSDGVTTNKLVASLHEEPLHSQ